MYPFLVSADLNSHLEDIGVGFFLVALCSLIAVETEFGNSNQESKIQYSITILYNRTFLEWLIDSHFAIPSFYCECWVNEHAYVSGEIF